MRSLGADSGWLLPGRRGECCGRLEPLAVGTGTNSVFLQKHVTFEMFDERAVSMRPWSGSSALRKALIKVPRQQIFRFDFAARHVIRNGEHTMPMALVNVPLPVFEALTGHLACRHFGVMLFEIEDHAKVPEF